MISERTSTNNKVQERTLFKKVYEFKGVEQRYGKTSEKRIKQKSWK
jgi:hypothetical protein